ncbi:MAG: DUF4139 domain-containing protein [Rhodanobacteraceae bacterium]|nr:MAG: DUF4139 domain-containing protein [Rhodanobacteraceae bacterium]
MHRRLLVAATAAIVSIPAALAAEGPALTVYHADNEALFTGTAQGTLDAGHALVHERRMLKLAAGTHEVRIGGLPATLDPEAIAVGFGAGPAVAVLGQRVVLANASASGALDAAIGSHITVNTGSGSLEGTLLGASSAGLLLRTADGQAHWLHQYASLTLPAGSVASGNSLLLDVDARAAGTRDASLTYTTAGIGWRAAYSATLTGGDPCHMQFKPEASIANRSGRDYTGATLKLVAGQPNFGQRGGLVAERFIAPMAAAAPRLPTQATLGDYRSFTLHGAISLPNGTVTLTPLYRAQPLACQRQYIVEDGNPAYPPHPNTNDYGAQDYRDRAIDSTLAFTAPAALPAGTLRAWLTGQDGTPALLGEGGVADSPKGQKVTVRLGQSFDLRASRDRTAFHVDAKAHRLSESYRITLSNGGAIARTVTVREHPSRWREWTVTASSQKATQETPQLLEFAVRVPARGKATLTYSVQYSWTAQDL